MQITLLPSDNMPGEIISIDASFGKYNAMVVPIQLWGIRPLLLHCIILPQSHFRHQLILLEGEEFNHAAITARSLFTQACVHSHISNHCLYSQILSHIAERTEVSYRNRKYPSFETAAKRIRTDELLHSKSILYNEAHL